MLIYELSDLTNEELLSTKNWISSNHKVSSPIEFMKKCITISQNPNHDDYLSSENVIQMKRMYIPPLKKHTENIYYPYHSSFDEYKLNHIIFLFTGEILDPLNDKESISSLFDKELNGFYIVEHWGNDIMISRTTPKFPTLEEVVNLYEFIYTQILQTKNS